jgi:hypothetical protein
MTFQGNEFVWVFISLVLIVPLALIGVTWLNRWLDRKKRAEP